MAKNKIIIWECPECGKIIASMYEAQLEQQKTMHKYTHKKEI
jgi:hypothetical protein